jgi:hypothetical protein
MAAEPRRKRGSSRSEKLINDANPDTERSTGPATQCRKQRDAISIPRRSARELSAGEWFVTEHPQKASPIRAITVLGWRKCVPLKVERKL